MTESEKTVTQQMMKDYEGELRQRSLIRAVEGFSRNWAPDDPREAHRFHAEIHALVSVIHADAQRPIADTIEKIIKAASFPYHVKPHDQL